VLGTNLTRGSDPGDGRYSGHDYEMGAWTSPWYSPGFAFGELVSSWNADTPTGTWIEVDMQESRSASLQPRKTSWWWVMGVWASGDETIYRTSVHTPDSLKNQYGPFGAVYTDTFLTKKFAVSYRLRVKLFRLPGSTATPKVRQVGAVSSVHTSQDLPTSPHDPAASVDLGVPQFSQEIHRGQYPQYDNGGEAWCSPTSTSMILAYWNRYPTPEQLAWVDPSYADPFVDYSARFVYDYLYDGAGNWPFNVAYAASFPGMTGQVTQLRSLYEAEQFIKAGIPLVVSVAFHRGKLKGFWPKATNGHLLTIVGFTPEGNVISNDPASPTDADVRHVYDRAQFEAVWRESTGGLAYVIHPRTVPLPLHIPGVTPNW
jgi:hypothetical protein